MKKSLLLLCLLLSTVSLLSLSAFDAARSLVEIEITKQSYNYNLPWVVRNQQIRKNGVLIEGRQILTTADGLSNQYLCRVKKGGVSRQYIAKVKWIDYHANVAVLTIDAEDFFTGMQSVPLASAIPQSGRLQVYRWRSGRIEERAAEIIRLYSGESKMSYVKHLTLSVSSEIESAGWSEIVCDEHDLIGLTASASSGKLEVLPAPFISSVLARYALNNDAGLGYFDFNYMQGKNPALLASKGLQKRDVGVIVTQIDPRNQKNYSLKVGDIILAIDGYSIDSEGKYMDPVYGRLSMSILATHMHNAGETLPLLIWRDYKEIAVNYIVPKADFTDRFIPEQRYDAAPEYLIAGGLVFQPINGPLLDALGSNIPVLLDYYRTQKSAQKRDGLIVLSKVLPDEYNLGYERLSLQIVDTVNGHKIDNLNSLQTALKKPINGFHHIQFLREENLQHIVLDAATMQAATERVLEHYQIPVAKVISK
jgi:hypothetical protein